MKKITFIISGLLLSGVLAYSNPVSPVIAKSVAANFYAQKATSSIFSTSNLELTYTEIAFNGASVYYVFNDSIFSTSNLELTYTETAANGASVFYVFNINPKSSSLNPTGAGSKGIGPEGGFVIVAASDVVSPVIGYSTKGHFVTPQPGSNVYYWLKGQAEIINRRASEVSFPSSEVGAEWGSYLIPSKGVMVPHLTTTAISSIASPVGGLVVYNVTTNSYEMFAGTWVNLTNCGYTPLISSNTQQTKSPNHKISQALNSVSPLCQTTWDQAPNYNAMCPGGSVTGCVATCMAQVVKYWNYPPHGIGSSFYYETSPENYGLLQANYDTSNYAWSEMPNSISSSNKEIAKLMYDCGVSVDMSYSPSESGAWVIVADDPICAQTSYIKYFGYNAKTIQGLKRKNYKDSAWMAMIENELNNSRVIEYAGWDSVQGGHTWVCDGYDTNNYLHMNWGWSGYDDGYYQLDTLNPDGFFFSKTHEIVIGIEPPNISASFDATPLTNCSGTTINFTDRSMVSNPVSPITSWQWSFPGGNPATSTTQNPSVVYTAGGTYPVTLIVSNSNGTDTLTQTKYITVDGINQLPFTQGFEGNSLPAQWTINNPWKHGTTWSQYTGTGGYGLSNHCLYYNNCSGGVKGERDQVYTPDYDFSAVTNPAIYFDVAYTPYNATYTDSLAVYYSLDCGNTFTRIYYNGGMNLCTTGGITVLGGANADVNGCFLPLSANWKTDTIKIPAIAGQSQVMFSFENRSDNGSSIFIDNINIPVVTGVNQLTMVGSQWSVFPNPSNGVFTFSHAELVSASQNKIEIYNVLGEKVYSSTTPTPLPHSGGSVSVSYSSNSSYQMNLTSQPNGVYLYKVINETGSLIGQGKLVIQK